MIIIAIVKEYVSINVCYKALCSSAVAINVFLSAKMYYCDKNRKLNKCLNDFLFTVVMRMDRQIKFGEI